MEKNAINRKIVIGCTNFADLVTKTLFTPSGSSNEEETKYNDKTPRGIRIWEIKKLAFDPCLDIGLINLPIFININSPYL
jgi:hypothetical protein